MKIILCVYLCRFTVEASVCIDDVGILEIIKQKSFIVDDDIRRFYHVR